LRISAAGRRGSSRPLIVETQAGTRLVKLRGAAQGTGALVAEIIVAELAEALGLSVPPRSLVALPEKIETADWDDELDDLLKASVGLNLGFNFLAGAVDFVPSDVARVAAEDRAAILWLDWVVMNPDRTARNPNLLWWADGLWLIDHGAALGFQYTWDRLTERAPREPRLSPEAHLFESAVTEDELRAADARLAPRLTRKVLEAATAAVPEGFLVLRAGDDPARRRATYAAYLWKRLQPVRPFLDKRAVPVPTLRRPWEPPTPLT
jgi:hypothetical protein